MLSMPKSLRKLDLDHVSLANNVPENGRQYLEGLRSQHSTLESVCVMHWDDPDQVFLTAANFLGFKRLRTLMMDNTKWPESMVTALANAQMRPLLN